MNNSRRFFCPNRLSIPAFPSLPYLSPPERGATGSEEFSEGVAAAELPARDGARKIADRDAFEVLARSDDVPGGLGVLEVKILVIGVDAQNPKLYFLNTNNHQKHYDFAHDVLGFRFREGVREFNGITYMTRNRKNLAGTLLAYDSFVDPSGGRGLYALEFWPTDPVGVTFVHLALDLIKRAMPFAATKLAYHAVGETQRELFDTERDEYARLGIRHVSTGDLYANIPYVPLNLGKSFGRLRLVKGADARSITISDLVIFDTLPNDLGHVAGVLTEEPQTPLSHINLKAKQNNTPNAYVKDAARHPEIEPLIGELAHIVVGSRELTVRSATQAEIEQFLDEIRPARRQVPKRDLERESIEKLDEIGTGDRIAFGAKAANVGQLRKIFSGEQVVPDGFAVPFHFYDVFMRENGLYEYARQMISESGFDELSEHRAMRLQEFRQRIKDAPIPRNLANELRRMQESFPQGKPIRCRSSTNNEDLQGFNGAGLYESVTHRKDEGHIGNSIKEVWASLWNSRAFEERWFHRIDHFITAMGVLVHPNFDDERVNGVAVTKNLFDENVEGFYINAQLGESQVANPDPGARPDQILVIKTVVSTNPQRFGRETIYVGRSNITKDGRHVMSPEQIDNLVDHLERIQARFAEIYGQQANRDFAMDVEFKVDRENRLAIKQARPWVD